MLPQDWKKEIDQTISEAKSAYEDAQSRTAEQNREIAARIEVLANELERYNSKQESEEPRKRRRENLTISGLIATAIFTFALAGFSLWQVIETRKAYKPLEDTANATAQAADVTFKIQQPYIFVPSPKFSISTTPQFQKFPVPNIDYTFVNEGLTPAIVRFRTLYIYTEEVVPKPVRTPIDNFLTLESFIIPKGGQHTMNFIIRGAPDLSNKSLPNTKTLMFWIEVQYFDIFDYIHTSRHLFYAAIKETGVGDFYAIAGEPYSHHDAVKAPPGKWKADLNAAPPYGQ